MSTVNYQPAQQLPQTDWKPDGATAGWIEGQRTADAQAASQMALGSQQIGLNQQLMEHQDFIKNQQLRDMNLENSLDEAKLKQEYQRDPQYAHAYVNNHITEQINKMNGADREEFNKTATFLGTYGDKMLEELQSANGVSPNGGLGGMQSGGAIAKQGIWSKWVQQLQSIGADIPDEMKQYSPENEQTLGMMIYHTKLPFEQKRELTNIGANTKTTIASERNATTLQKTGMETAAEIEAARIRASKGAGSAQSVKDAKKLSDALAVWEANRKGIYAKFWNAEGEAINKPDDLEAQANYRRIKKDPDFKKYEEVKSIIQGAGKLPPRSAGQRPVYQNSSVPQPSAEAIAYLKANPQFKEQFRTKYGFLPEGM